MERRRGGVEEEEEEEEEEERERETERERKRRGRECNQSPDGLRGSIIDFSLKSRVSIKRLQISTDISAEEPRVSAEPTGNHSLENSREKPVAQSQSDSQTGRGNAVTVVVTAADGWKVVPMVPMYSRLVQMNVDPDPEPLFWSEEPSHLMFRSRLN
ncbi:unnamed protein product [Pleuronectes platessa]|uniref:Uncharacterized protein n=1 Tax=Pleuronectes platessa TaxID=8262 RepID=A0A9N7UHE0_PLEPL|nr:unnamed protein product [Pleuronectes platessa]